MTKTVDVRKRIAEVIYNNENREPGAFHSLFSEELEGPLWPKERQNYLRMADAIIFEINKLVDQGVPVIER